MPISATRTRMDSVTLSQETRFHYKPWVADQSQFLNDHPGDGWIIVASDRPANSATEAKRLAVKVAAGRLVVSQ